MDAPASPCAECGDFHYYGPSSVDELYHASLAFLERFEVKWAGKAGVTLPKETALAWGRLREALGSFGAVGNEESDA